VIPLNSNKKTESILLQAETLQLNCTSSFTGEFDAFVMIPVSENSIRNKKDFM
jgi:hypothetical protein